MTLTSSVTVILTLLIVTLALTSLSDGTGRFSWMLPDRFDEIDARIRSVDAGNCRSKSRDEMMLSEDVVSQLPVYNQLRNRLWYKNRTSLIHIHNMALNRAFFYSFVLQRMNDTKTFTKQPGWLYYYLSAGADINANPNMLNASAVYFDNNCHYPNWYTTIPFNVTIPLFGPKAFRWDNYKDQGNFMREPSRNTAHIRDIGAGTNKNFTVPTFKMNNWYTRWLPDTLGNMDSVTKFTYYIGIKMSDQTGRFITDTYMEYNFFGPNSPSAADTDSRKLPVAFTVPYFDCGRSNKWVVSAVSPIVDFMPRYSNWTHLRRQRFIGVVAMDTDFQEIDFNACGVSPGNPGPSYLSGVARCKPTTACKHRNGKGFRRGGYTCVCDPGRRYPWWLTPPYLGTDIEQATDTEYKFSYTCSPTDYKLVLPVIESANFNPDVSNKKKRAFYGNDTHGPSPSLSFESEAHTEIDPTDHLKGEGHEASQGHSSPTSHERLDMADALRTLTPEALKSLPPEFFTGEKTTPQQVELDYIQKNDVDVSIELDYQEDLREHHRYNNHLRELDNGKNHTHLRKALEDSLRAVRNRHMERFNSDRGNLQSKRRRKRSSVFDQQALTRVDRILKQKGSVTASNCRSLPAHRLVLPGDVAYGVQEQFEAEGRTALRLSNFVSAYLQISEPDDNFGNVRGGGRLHVDQMFGEVIANVMGNYRISSSGIFFDRYKFENQDGSRREFFGPWAFRKESNYFAYDSAGLRHSYVDEEWFERTKARFSANFSGLKKYVLRSYVRGVVTVDVKLDYLEIDQCPQPFGVANAFKNTARCDYFSTTCRKHEGFPFRIGSYGCRCRVGFEYWHYDGKQWFDGSFIEGEYEKKMKGIFSRFDFLYCRASSASFLSPSIAHILLVASATIIGIIRLK